MRRKSGWVRECEGEGGRENLRLYGVSPALSLTSAANGEISTGSTQTPDSGSMCIPASIP